jgi:hypothetical protein
MVYGLPGDAIVSYSMFAVFLFYISMYHSRSDVKTPFVEFLLIASIICGAVCNVAFLVYAGWYVNWWSPLILIACFIPFLFFGVLLQGIIGRAGIAWIGIVGWPICAVAMFTSIP